MSYIWPIALVILANTVYQICAKSVPGGSNPFASLTVTYVVGAIASAILYFTIGGGTDLAGEYRRLNWAPFALGVVIVGLEVGFIYAYKNGWHVSSASIVQSAFLAVTLLIVGALLYKEAITPQKVAGIVICLIGLYIINR